MSKRIAMTRERKIAVPVLLRYARAATRHVPMTDKELDQLEKALEAFRDC